MAFERIGSETIWEGKIIKVGQERFRHDDGEEVTREKVWHPGAVGILAVDDRCVWLTRQPREVVEDPASLEIPAGKLDVEGEPPEQTAKRELAEEIAKQAASWEQLFVFHTSPGFSDERVWLYLATDLSDAPGIDPDEGERIEVVPWPLERLDEAIADCEDSKSLIALLWLAARSASGPRTAAARCWRPQGVSPRCVLAVSIPRQRPTSARSRAARTLTSCRSAAGSKPRCGASIQHARRRSRRRLSITSRRGRTPPSATSTSRSRACSRATGRANRSR